MFTAFLLGALAIAYIVLKTLNMRARFAEEDARRLAEQKKAEEEAEAAAEDEMIREAAVDVDAEVIGNDDEAGEEPEEEE